MIEPRTAMMIVIGVGVALIVARALRGRTTGLVAGLLGGGAGVATGIAVFFFMGAGLPISSGPSAVAPISDEDREEFTQLAGRVSQRLLAEPKFVEMLGGDDSPASLERLSQTLTAQGLRRLDEPQLVGRAATIGEMLVSADVVTCAAWARGTPTPEQVAQGLLRLDSPRRQLFFSVGLAAALAELAGTPAPEMTLQERVSAIAALGQGRSSAEHERLKRTLAAPAQASDEQACWAARTVYTTVPSMPAPHRAILARMLVEPSA